MQLSQRRPSFFQGEPCPPQASLVGLAALLSHFRVEVPLRRRVAVSDKNFRDGESQYGEWRVFGQRYWPGDQVADHLTFAIKYETLDLLVWKKLLTTLPRAELVSFILRTPTGVHSRKVWFLYEFLTGQFLDEVADAVHGRIVDLQDPDLYFTGAAIYSKRHRLNNNLLGTARLCPVVRKTPALQAITAAGLDGKARALVGANSRRLVARAASFLLMADSQASFAIEGEKPPQKRIERWGNVIHEAGRRALSLSEIERLHDILIGDQRFISIGLRSEGIFLGERTHEGEPLPEFIGARPQDLRDLMEGLFEAGARMKASAVDPVVEAAALAFAFVYIHPLEDGNGRLHRYILHHVLADRKFVPPGLVFPVSAVMLDRIDEYLSVLQSHSSPLLPLIRWHMTAKRNVEVENETADLYRFYDCTREVEFIYECVRETVEHSLPREIEFMKSQDEAERAVAERVEMPDQLVKKLIAFIRQNEGRLGRKRREGEFARLTDAEVFDVEKIVKEAFERSR